MHATMGYSNSSSMYNRYDRLSLYRCDGAAFGKADGGIGEHAGTLVLVAPSPATTVTVLAAG